MPGVTHEEHLDRATGWLESPTYHGLPRPGARALVDAVQAKGRAMVEAVRAPYPEDVFTPLSPSDVQLALAAIRAAIGHAGGERLYAQWRRDLGGLLAADVDEVPEAPDGRE